MLTGMTTGGKTSDASLMEPVKTTNVKRANEVSKWDETFESGTQYLT